MTLEELLLQNLNPSIPKSRLSYEQTRLNQITMSEVAVLVVCSVPMIDSSSVLQFGPWRVKPTTCFMVVTQLACQLWVA